ncbi:MAG: hypothetical protein IBX56_07120 [Methylomicrobium sp.]|nr:hypothetical protein [Methylomicrobium sp.]
MYVLFSGEGPSDLGRCDLGLDRCDAEDFQTGPMGWVVDQLIESFQGFEFSHIESGCVSFVSETYLAANKAPPTQKARLPGKKKPPETQYYFENARALAIAAQRKSLEINGDKVIAVLFHDSDGTASAGRGDWANKRQSILAGYAVENYEYGVAMMPKPKSEAWLLCAVKDNPYQHCQKLEDESGNDTSQNPLKEQLSKALQGKDSAEQINDMISNHEIDVHRIDMPSFNAFKHNLNDVVRRALGLPLGD